MEDVSISKFRAQVVRSGSTPASPGFVVSEGQNPVNPSGSGQNHLPVTIATASTGLSITESQVLGGAGTVGQYIRGDGSLADFPATTGGGSSVSYYLNGSVSQGTIGGVAYKELNRTPIFGAGTDITINADGYIASFITDALDPNKLLIPAGNWNFETYFSASSSGGSPSFYIELYKYNGTTFTLIATSIAAPELIAFGTNLNPYFSTLAVPETVLALTDRLALRYYVTHSGRTITLHTENNHLCQVITTFTTGLTALNGLTSQVQYLTVGTSGTDFAISSASDTHTFNLPTASATNRGALSSADWTTFNNKTSNLGTVTSVALTMPAAFSVTGSPITSSGTLAVTATGTTAQYIRGDGTLATFPSVGSGTVTSVGLSSATSGVTIGSTPITTSGTITLAIATASGSQNGLLSSTDWTTFNGKQNALTNPVTGTGTSGTIPVFTSSTTIGNSIIQSNSTQVNIVGYSSQLLFDSTGQSKSGGIQYVGDFELLINNSRGTGSAIYLGSQNLDFHTNVSGNPRVRITNSGNVGINTSTPATTLEINGVGLFSGGSLVGNTKNGIYIYDTVIASLAGGNSRSLQIQAQTLSIFTGTTYTEKVKIFENGNVVISTSPSDAGFKLDVKGTGRFNSSLNIVNSTGSTTPSNYLQIEGSIANNSNYPGISLKGGTLATTYPNIALTNGGIGLSINNGTATAYNNPAQINLNNGIINFLTGDNAAATERMRIAIGGSVGINNTSPMNTAWGTDASTKQLSIDASGYAVINLTGSTSRKYSMGVGDGNFYMCYDNTAGRHNISVTSGGSVLIGTTTDNGVGKLQISGGGVTVAGGVRFSSSGADANRWSVYWNGGTGDLIVVNNISDIRAKKDFDYNIKGLETINKLKPLKFTWKDGTSHSTSVSGRLRQYGFIAQETMAADDYLAWYNQSQDTWGIEQYESFSAVIVKAIQEQQEIINDLKQKIG